MENEKKFFLVQYPLWEIDVQLLKDIYDSFSETLKKFKCDYGLVFMPNIFQLNEISKEQLTDIKDMITYLLEKKDDTDSETGAGIEDSDRTI